MLAEQLQSSEPAADYSELIITLLILAVCAIAFRLMVAFFVSKLLPEKRPTRDMWRAWLRRGKTWTPTDILAADPDRLWKFPDQLDDHERTGVDEWVVLPDGETPCLK